MTAARLLKPLAAAGVVAALLAAPAVRAGFEITAALQKELDKHVEKIKAWGADPALSKSVFWAAQKGPISGMDNDRWRTIRRSDDIVVSSLANDAGKFLAKKLEASGGVYVRAFVCGKHGEQIASTEKTEQYFYGGQPRFDVPFRTAMTWQGPPELDADTDTHDIQIAAPVVASGKTIGVLVVGVNLTRLEKTIGK